MLKSTKIIKTVGVTTICSFALTCMPKSLYANQGLSPQSFNQMYSLAKSGEVEALRASVFRGLNIDSVNENGDTGLCIAAQKHDAYAYNSFRAAGANPRHPCTQKISDYEEFVNSYRTVSMEASPREAYGALGKEEYKVSSKVWWWLGAATLIGGITVIILSKSGGGGKSDSNNDDTDHESKSYKSLGGLAGSEAVIQKTTTNIMDNSKSFTSTNKEPQKIQKIDLMTNVLNNTKYIDVILNAKKGGSYTNTADGKLKLGIGTIGLSAVKDSYITNNGYINIDSSNASIAMVASEKSNAVNNGTGVISGNEAKGIDMFFSGYSEKNTIIGMYADTSSIINNNGDIKGTAILQSLADTDTAQKDDKSGLLSDLENAIQNTAKASSSLGTIIGMQAMIVNVGTDLNKNTILVQNTENGKINLSAGDGGTEAEIKVSLIGMGSYLNNEFLNGSQNINRAEKVELTNNGTIKIGYTGKYTSSATDLRKGVGGIVGIRADANSTAVNYGNIEFLLEDSTVDSTANNNSSSTSGTNLSAAMLSVHGGEMANSSNISIITPATNPHINYGMLAVEGSGTVSGLYTNKKQTLTNRGDIKIEAANSYGIASYKGGVLQNIGTITMGKNENTTLYKNNIAMYGYGKTIETNLINTGTVDIYSYNSIAMKNDFQGAQLLQNDGIINIFRSATDSKVFAGYYSVAKNNGNINYYTTSIDTPSEKGTADDPFSNYNIKVKSSIMTTKSAAETSSSTTEEIYNNSEKNINIYGSSFTSAMSVETERGQAFNKGTISINKYIYDSESNSIGMYLYGNSSNFATIINDGKINTEAFMSTGMASSSTQNAAMVNNGIINAKKDYSIGIYSDGRNVIKNNNQINMLASDSVGVYINGNANTLDNIGKINMVGEKNTTGIFVKGNNNTINNKSGSEIILQNGSAVNIIGDNNTFINNKNAKLYTEKGNAINVSGSDTTLINKGSIHTSDGYGIYVTGDGVNITNEGVIYSTNYGIYVNNSNQSSKPITITNNGIVSTDNHMAIYVNASGTSETSKTSITNTTLTVISVGVASEDVYLDVNSITGVYTDHNYELPDPKQEDFEANIKVTADPWKKKYIPSKASGSSVNSKQSLRFVNNGKYTAKSIDFDNDYIDYIISQNGTYQAETLQGTVSVDLSVVQNSNDTTYTIKNAFIGENKGINIADNLYMFKSNLKSNNSGNIDIVMDLRNIKDLIDNDSLSEYLSNNYNNNQATNTFNQLKAASGAEQFNSLLQRKFALGFIPNLVKQSLDIEKTVNSEINDNVLQQTDKRTRSTFNMLSYKNKIDSKQTLYGYEDKVVSAYGYTDKQLNNHLRLGYGLALARSDSSFDDTSSRYNNMLEAFIPANYYYRNFSVLAKPKLGFARGHYRRIADNTKYKAKTKEYYYGVDTLAKQNYNLGMLELEPNLGFNITNLYTDSATENNNGLKLHSKNIVSAQSVIGLDVKKQFNFNSNNSLYLSSGAKYYHEFGNRYRPSVSAPDMVGFYKLSDDRMERDFGVLNIKADYTYKAFNIGSAIYLPLEAKHKEYYMLNLGYKF